MPRGEICFRGPPVFVGYYKSPELTADALDEDGWLHSGDIGVRLPTNGAIKLIDRKKNFFKLQQGEYVSAEKIENAYSKSYFVNQIFVYGDSLQIYLIAVVVLDEGYVRKKWTREHGIQDSAGWEDICRNPKLADAVLADMNLKAKEEKLLGFEVVKKIHIEPKAWTSDDLLTPTQKLMRFKAKVKYEGIIRKLYSEA
jgi:long-chain acyl-CoA synthetase